MRTLFRQFFSLIFFLENKIQFHLDKLCCFVCFFFSTYIEQSLDRVIKLENEEKNFSVENSNFIQIKVYCSHLLLDKK